MPTRKRRRPTTLALAILSVVSVSVVGSLAYYVANTPANKVPANEHRNLREASGNAANRTTPSIEVKVDSVRQASSAEVLTPKYNRKGDLSFEKSDRRVPKGEDARVFAVNEFLGNAKVTPEGTRLLAIDVKDGVATLSFNAALTSAGYGSDDERTFVNGVLATLAQFKEIKSVLFVADGQPVETLGHLELVDPQPVRPGSEAPAKREP